MRESSAESGAEYLLKAEVTECAGGLGWDVAEREETGMIQRLWLQQLG
jgi:hypothetical protein